MAEPVVSRKTYLLTFGGLLGLTLLTTLLGFVDMGALNSVVALFIAALKASLIAVFFMHALHGSPLVRAVIAGGLIWLLMLISLTLSDYVSRGWG